MATWFDEVKACVGWDETDQARIAELRCCLDSKDVEVVGSIGRQLAQLKGMQPLMSNTRFASRWHSVLWEWFMGLLDGVFDGERVEKRWALGKRLADVDLTFGDIILLEGLARRRLFELAKIWLGENSDLLSAMMYTLDKALNLDLALIYSGYLPVRDAEMERVLLDRFITVTGFSRTLYENLAEAQGRAAVVQ